MNVMDLRPVVIGGGNLGGAVARGLAKAGVKPLVVQTKGPNFDGLVKDGIETYATIDEALPLSRGPIFIALKPWLVLPYCSENSALLAGRTIVSCAALVDIVLLRKFVPSAHWGRVMPNIAAAVRAGFTGIVNGNWNESEFATVRELCALFGDEMVVSEQDLDGIVSLSGSAIAYVLDLLEGFIQGGLAVGIKDDVSLRAGLAVLEGTAKLVKQRGIHPAILKDSVCTPGGTTIAGIRVLEDRAFKGAFIDALVATAEKAQQGAAAYRAAQKK